ncbi:hypothetical protein Tco_0877604 [Tanacetum coccineum]|uniref:Reverse transcriptase domain-containing protein n=1 Tax=Tanacetum coccineum TaxID=301880 RepID=A0ABQ5BYR8_9ASTR
MNELNELRDQAYDNSLIYKEKTKRIHDSKIKNRVFNVGDQVLLFNSRLKIFSGKLKTRWTGPFIVTQVFPYGTVELSQTDVPNFKIFEASGARGFCPSFTRASHPQLHFGNPISKSYRLTDDDSPYGEDINYVDASPPDADRQLRGGGDCLSPTKVGGIDDDILLTIKDDILHEKLLNVNLLVANIKALKDNPLLSDL